MTTFELINELSDLPVKERVLLIDGLLQSIHQPESTIDAVWLDEAENGGGVLRVQVLHPDGSSAETRIVATTKLSRPAGFPQMLSEGNDLIVAWTDTEGQTSRVKSKRIILLDSTPGLTDQ